MGLYAASDQRTRASAIRSQDRRRLRRSARAAAASREHGLIFAEVEVGPEQPSDDVPWEFLRSIGVPDLESGGDYG